jgi:hypothetical protein
VRTEIEPARPTRAKYCSVNCKERYLRLKRTSQKLRVAEEKAAPFRDMIPARRCYGVLSALWFDLDGLWATFTAEGESGIWRCPEFELFALLAPHLVESIRHKLAGVRWASTASIDDLAGFGRLAHLIHGGGYRESPQRPGPNSPRAPL